MKSGSDKQPIWVGMILLQLLQQCDQHKLAFTDLTYKHINSSILFLQDIQTSHSTQGDEMGTANEQLF